MTRIWQKRKENTDTFTIWSVTKHSVESFLKEKINRVPNVYSIFLARYLRHRVYNSHVTSCYCYYELHSILAINELFHSQQIKVICANTKKCNGENFWFIRFFSTRLRSQPLNNGNKKIFPVFTLHGCFSLNEKKCSASFGAFCGNRHIPTEKVTF